MTIETLKICRNSESFNSVREISNKKCEIVKDLIDEVNIEMDFKEAKLPQQRPSKRRLDICEFTADKHELTEVEDFHRVTHYYPALDKIILELKTRFAENDNKVLCSLGKIITIENPDAESFKVVSEFYS